MLVAVLALILLAFIGWWVLGSGPGPGAANAGEAPSPTLTAVPLVPQGSSGAFAGPSPAASGLVIYGADAYSGLPSYMIPQGADYPNGQ